MSYFDGVKVGDKLWSAQFGWGVVGEIRGGKYPIGFEWRNGECLEFYDMDGKAGDDELQTLFWDEVKFTPPPRPHRKVWKNGWVNIYQENKSMRWGYIFNTIESAIETSRGALGYITTTPITWEEEE